VFEEVDRSHILDNFIDPGSARLIELETSSNNEIIGNTLDRGDVGIGLFGASTGNLVLRNIITMSAEAMYVDTAATGNRIFHNTMYMSGSIGDASPDAQFVNNLEADQGFVDPAAFDFHLVVGNPAIDGGSDLGLDLLPDSPERFLGAAPDLGAVETR
jgi:parallel beta-helix repeat protein